MKKLTLLIFMLLVAVSCTREVTKPVEDYETNPDVPSDEITPPEIVIEVGEKPLTKNIPSVDKYVKWGTHVGEKTMIKSNPGVAETYNVLERLYSTVWYRSDKSQDDNQILEGKVEFLVFDSLSRLNRLEYDNGIKYIDGAEVSDFEVIKKSLQINTPSSGTSRNMNAIVVKNNNKDKFDTLYEGFFLAEQNILYVITAEDEDTAYNRLLSVVKGNVASAKRFILSTVALEK